MAKLFKRDSEFSDDDISLKTNNEYAKNYNNWRQKEEYHKLKTKYGEHILDPNQYSDESDSSSDDDDVEISEKLEVDFFKTLSSIKTKDPKIYDANIKFFDDTPIDIKTEKKPKEEKMFLKDYERKMLLKNGGILLDSDEDEAFNTRSTSPTYIEEQRKLKSNLQQIAENIEDDNENEWGGMFKVRSKTKEEKDLDDSEYKQWLMGEKEHLRNSDTEKKLEPLKQYWNNPRLDKGEKFLRDYILNSRFLEKTDPNHVPTYDEIIHDSDDGFSEDEANIAKQDEFEHKYNYRFEEPDQDFIKRYPRTMENSLRRPDDKRKLKRAEVKERKIKEKEEKFEEIRKMKELKRKEIEERIEKLREVTGNTKVAFEDMDLEEDFDPEAHDKRMQKLFDKEFYQDEEGEQKPEFPELDDELEIERWDKWDGNNESVEDNVHCEDDNFNMDCDFKLAGKASSRDELQTDDSKGGRKKRKRKSTFAKTVSRPKPAFDPNDNTYEGYLDEYYKLDCEDVIGDVPCRFKYRKVVPNSFGLTVDEILNADDRELNKWCSIKKAVQFRPDHIEKYDVIAYSNKAGNHTLKMKILPSLFENDDEKPIKGDKKDGLFLPDIAAKRTVTKRRKFDDLEDLIARKPNNNKRNGEEDIFDHSLERESKKKKCLLKDNNSGDATEKKSNVKNKIDSKAISKKKRNGQQQKTKNSVVAAIDHKNRKNDDNPNSKKSVSEKRKHVIAKDLAAIKKGRNHKSGPDLVISDVRLKAFGIKPKKYRNKIKFGSSNQ